MESALRDGVEPGLCLIETLRWDGARFAHLPLHMARLHRSAARLGWRCEGAAAALYGAVGGGEAARVRLTLDAAGQVAVTVAPLPAAAEVWRVGLAKERLWSGDTWLGVKSTRRAAYDAARAALLPGTDEVIFQNERGEVCDGTITTVFFDRGAGMRTPPLSAGVLPGVLRASMNVAEERLLTSEVPQVRLWVGNALRGLIPAVWVG